MSGPNFQWVSPPFDIVRVAHVELVVTDLDASARFYVDLLGLVVTERTDDAIYLRGYEERLHHSLVLRLGRVPLVDHVAFRVARPGDLDALARTFEDIGCSPRFVEGAERGQGPGLRVHDPLGFPLEFFHEMEPAECLLWRYDLYAGARPMRFDHVNFFVPEVAVGFEQYRALGFRCSEYIADDRDDSLLAAWLYRKPTVHDVAFTTGKGPRLHHLAFTAMDAAAIVWTCELLGASDFAIERGPGRHGVSNAFFLYLRDPDGHRIELYASDYYTGDPDHAPIRWSASDPRRRSFWGSVVPDSWYEEGSLVRGSEGAPTDVVATSRDERLVAAE